MSQNKKERKKDIIERTLFFIKCGRYEVMEFHSILQILNQKCGDLIQIHLALLGGFIGILLYLLSNDSEITTIGWIFIIISLILSIITLITLLVLFWPRKISMMNTLGNNRFRNLNKKNVENLLKDQLYWLKKTRNENFKQLSILNIFFKLSLVTFLLFLLSLLFTLIMIS